MLKKHLAYESLTLIMQPEDLPGEEIRLAGAQGPHISIYLDAPLRCGSSVTIHRLRLADIS